MKKLAQGFAAPLILLVIGLIVGAGVIFVYFQFKSKSATQLPPTATPQTTFSSEPVINSTLSADETAGWKLYSDDYLSFKYPANFTVKYLPSGEPLGGWIITPNECSNDILCFRDGTMEIIKGSMIDSYGKENPFDNFFGDCIRVEGSKSNSVVNGLPAVKVSYTLTAQQITQEPCFKENKDYQGFLASHYRPETDYKIEQYFVVAKNAGPLRVEMSSSSGDKGRSQVLNTIVESIKLK